ncbi:MAG: DUF3078 domain-containing protein [Flavobacteriales bacterium]|nr:DUF3078 domain-containing protein [Flavobacteriales bacterium]
MRKSALALLLALSAFSAFTQTTDDEKELVKTKDVLKAQNKDTVEGWKTGGVFSVNLTQVSLTNWNAGGNSSVSVNGVLSLFANYKKGNNAWDNSLDLGYGILKQDGEGVRKSDDKIEFTSKYGRKAIKNWYYAALINFKSQMTAGYNYPDDSTVISNFLAPGYALVAIGLDYKPSDVLTLFISPLTMKATIVNDQNLADAGAFGVDPAEYDNLGTLVKRGSNLRAEYGGYLRAQVKKDIMENVNFQSRIDLFSNYSEEPLHIDVNWEVLIAMKVNKYISATVTTNLIYDHDVDIAVDENNDGITDAYGPRVQFKEVLGVGLSYKF